MSFNNSTLEQEFSNVQRIEGEKIPAYRVVDQHGNDAGAITFLTKTELRVYVDNYPAQKQYFSSNLPIKTLDQFIADIDRTGLKLIKQN